MITFTEPQITTIVGRDAQLGASAIVKIHEILIGEKVSIPDDMQKLSIRGSCGCKWDKESNQIPDIGFLKFSKNMLYQYYHRKEFITSDFITNVTTAGSLAELTELINGYKNMLYNAVNMDVCLCEDWKMDFADTSNYRKSGYSENIISVLSDSTNGKLFSVKKLIPYLSAEHEPMLTVFTSLFWRDQILGYTAVSFREVSDICIDEYYVNWCDSVANGFRVIQEKMYKDYIQHEIMLRTLHDPSTGLLNKRGLREQSQSFIKADMQYAVILLAHKEDREKPVIPGFETPQLIANAIRLTSNKNDLYSRLSDNIFCIFIPLESGMSARSAADKRLIEIEKRMQYMQGNMKSLFRCEIESELIELDGNDLMYLDEMLINQMQNLSYKLNDKLPYGDTLKEQLYRLRREIMLAPQNDWSIEKIASGLGLSVSYFQHSYKAEFSVSCLDDIIIARIERAKQLLTSSDLRISEIADQCGYQSNRHFSRQFRQYTGTTPTEYRKATTS